LEEDREGTGLLELLEARTWCLLELAGLSVTMPRLLLSLLSLFTHVRGRGPPVEKVVVSPVGGSREPENKAKTLRKQRIQPLNRGQKRARKSFSTG